MPLTWAQALLPERNVRLWASLNVVACVCSLMLYVTFLYPSERRALFVQHVYLQYNLLTSVLWIVEVGLPVLAYGLLRALQLGGFAFVVQNSYPSLCYLQVSFVYIGEGRGRAALQLFVYDHTKSNLISTKVVPHKTQPKHPPRMQALCKMI